MIKNKITLIIIFFSLLLYSCQSVKDGLQGKKRSEQSDEFLVEKKNPLAMPPDYEKLPTPGNQEISTETSSKNKEVKDLLNIQDDSQIDINNDTNSTDVESSIIKQIQ